MQDVIDQILSTVENPSPYKQAAMEYMLQGWEPMPLPLGQKFPPPKKMTGRNRLQEYPEILAMTEWLEGDSNIAIRLPDDIVGIDVDGDEGVRQLSKLIKKLGALPVDYMVSSHPQPLVEGFTAYFRIPQGIEFFKSGLDKKIDIIREQHRYSVVAPSIHPSGRMYSWFESNGSIFPSIPHAFDLPLLPSAWIEFIKKTKEDEKIEIKEESRTIDFKPLESVENTEVSDAYGKACSALRKMTDKVDSGASRHDFMVRNLQLMCSMSKCGHGGIIEAANIFKCKWVKGFTPHETKNRDVSTEFDLAFQWAQENSKPFPKKCMCGKGQKTRLFAPKKFRK